MSGHTVHKYLKFLLLFAAIGAISACGPRRAEFSLGRKAQSNSTTQNAARENLLDQAELTIESTDEQLATLQEVVARMDASTTPLRPGMFRILRTIDPVTRKPEQWKQSVSDIENGLATLEQINLTSGERFEDERLEVDHEDRIETGIRALAAHDLKTLYEALKPLLLAYHGILKTSPRPELPAKPKLRIRVVVARYLDIEAKTTFRLLLRLSLVDIPKTAPLAFEAHVVPEYPKPFRVVYKKWGKGRPVHSVLDVAEFSP